MLDAELLADVYINMTRGQEALLIDTAAAHGDGGGAMAIDLSSFDLPILLADAEELEAHAGVVRQLDKASGGRTLWPLTT